nr:hypothetical protein HmN_000094400 [Hymenolepis microstoma]
MVEKGGNISSEERTNARPQSVQYSRLMTPSLRIKLLSSTRAAIGRQIEVLGLMCTKLKPRELLRTGVM